MSYTKCQKSLRSYIVSLSAK